MKAKVVKHSVVGLYVQKDGTEEFEIWLAPECPYDCKECVKSDVIKAKAFRQEDKFRVKKIIFK